MKTKPSYRALLVPMEHLHLELTDGLSALLDCTANFGEEVYGGWLGFGENVDVIRGHAFLSDEYLFRAVDDEISSRVIRTFV